MGKKPDKTAHKARKRDPRDASAQPARAPVGLRHLLPLACAIGFALLVYSNSFSAPFLFDNNEIILQDTRVHALTAEHLRAILAGPYWEIRLINLYRPLTTLSFLFNYAVLGDRTTPGGYHWLNFGLHAINICLVYALGMVVFRSVGRAWLLSLLWSVHPVLTESVTNVVGRADLLAAFGVLASLLAYHKAIGATGRRRAAWLAAAGIAAGVGIFSKESAIVILPILALFDLAFVRAVPWRRRLAGYIGVTIPCALYFAARAVALRALPYTPVPFTDNPLVGAGFWASRLTAVKVIGSYLMLLIWPAKLSCDYSYNAIRLFGGGGWEDGKAVLALLICIAAAGAAAYSYRRDSRVFFGIGFFFVTLAPTSNVALKIGTIMAERFLYLPAIGFLICVLCACERAQEILRPAGGGRWLAWSAAAAVLLAAGIRTHQRNEDWGNEQRLWDSAVEAAPESYKARVMRTAALEHLGAEHLAQAIADMDRAMQILDGLPDDRNTWEAYSDAGQFYLGVGDAARNGIIPAAELPQTNPEFWYRRALMATLRCERIVTVADQEHARAYARVGQPGLTFIPAHVYLLLGRAYLALSDRPHALAAFERGRTLESDPDLLEELASMYQQDGHLRAAAQALVEALYMDAGRVQTRSRLVDLYAQIDPAGCSVTAAGAGRDLNPECPLVHNDICSASRAVVGHYLQRGLEADAAKSLRVAKEELGCDVKATP